MTESRRLLDGPVLCELWKTSLEIFLSMFVEGGPYVNRNILRKANGIKRGGRGCPVLVLAGGGEGGAGGTLSWS